jgi:hypothetical protein
LYKEEVMRIRMVTLGVLFTLLVQSGVVFGAPKNQNEITYPFEIFTPLVPVGTPEGLPDGIHYAFACNVLNSGRQAVTIDMCIHTNANVFYCIQKDLGLQVLEPGDIETHSFSTPYPGMRFCKIVVYDGDPQSLAINACLREPYGGCVGELVEPVNFPTFP